MTGYLHLLRRGSRYWFRRRMPGRIRPIIGRVHLTLSLKTSDPTLARSRCGQMTAAFERCFSMVLSRMDSTNWAPSKAEIADLLRAVYERILDERELHAAARPEGTIRPQALLAGMPAHESQGYDGNRVFTEEEQAELDYLNGPDWEIQMLEGSRDTHHYDFVEPYLTAALQARSINVDPAAPMYRMVARRAMTAAIHAVREAYNREHGVYGTPDSSSSEAL